MFIVDESGSIRDKNKDNADGSDNFQKIADFLKRIVENLAVGSTGIRIALVRFSNNATIDFFLNEYSTKPGYYAAIQAMVDRYNGDNTNTTGGLFVARTRIFSELNGARADVRRVAIVVTDGEATIEHEELPLEATSLKRIATVLAVGVSSAVDENQLAQIASPGLTYNVQDFQSLITSNIMENLNDNVCMDVPRK